MLTLSSPAGADGFASCIQACSHQSVHQNVHAVLSSLCLVLTFQSPTPVGDVRVKQVATPSSHSHRATRDI